MTDPVKDMRGSRMSYFEVLRKRRLRAGLRQDQLAEMLEVRAATISRWETGDIAPPIGQLERWAAALGATARIVIADDDDPYEQLRTVLTAEEAAATYHAILNVKKLS